MQTVGGAGSAASSSRSIGPVDIRRGVVGGAVVGDHVGVSVGARPQEEGVEESGIRLHGGDQLVDDLLARQHEQEGLAHQRVGEHPGAAVGELQVDVLEPALGACRDAHPVDVDAGRRPASSVGSGETMSTSPLSSRTTVSSGSGE